MQHWRARLADDLRVCCPDELEAPRTRAQRRSFPGDQAGRELGCVADEYGERDGYWRDYRALGRLFGLRARDRPSRWQGLSDYLEAVLASDTLWVSPQARELGVQIVLRPPVPLAARPLLELANFVTVGLLPAGLRQQYGLRWDPVRGLVHRGGAEYTRRILLPQLPGRLRWGHRAALAT